MEQKTSALKDDGSSFSEVRRFSEYLGTLRGNLTSFYPKDD